MNNTLEKRSLSDILQKYGALLTLILVVLALAIISPDFRTMDNFMKLLRQASVNGLIAFGMTAVILTGGIDLSVGSTLAVSSLVCAMMMKAGIDPIVSMIAALALGIGLGCTSGVLVTKGRLQPFIATLITMTVYRGLTHILSGGKPVSNLIAAGDTGASAAVFSGFGKGMLWEIPVPVIIFAICFVIFLFVLSRTVTGRRIYATGSNEKAARLAGVNTDSIKLFVYAISGMFAAIGGLVILSRLGSAQPTAGQGYELDAIAAVVLGGTALAGGRGRVLGTLVGALIIGVLDNGLILLNVDQYWITIVKGTIIVVAVIIDQRKNR